MRQNNSIQPTALLLSLFLAILAVGCGGSLRSFTYDDHAIRIDERHGRDDARVYVDQCQVPGVYYDREFQRWGVHGYTYGPSYFQIDVLAEDLASWGAAEWCDPRHAPPGLGQHASTDSSPPDA